MADEFNGSNRPCLIGADQIHNPTSSEPAIIGSWDSSSSSFLNTSFGSDLDSSETDNDDEFIAELTRQMADYMLQEDDDDKNSKKLISQVKNQHRVGENSRQRTRGKMTESTQPMKSSRGGGRVRPVGGSGMRAVFLNGPGSKNGCNGTGVFLPRSATDTTAHSRKKPGCSTALVPTRVLQALERHFNNMKSLSPSSNLLHIQPNYHGYKKDTQHMVQSSTDQLETNLPQEWTY